MSDDTFESLEVELIKLIPDLKWLGHSYGCDVEYKALLSRYEYINNTFRTIDKFKSDIDELVAI